MLIKPELRWFYPINWPDSDVVPRPLSSQRAGPSNRQPKLERLSQFSGITPESAPALSAICRKVRISKAIFYNRRKLHRSASSSAVNGGLK